MLVLRNFRDEGYNDEGTPRISVEVEDTEMDPRHSDKKYVRVGFGLTYFAKGTLDIMYPEMNMPERVTKLILASLLQQH